MPMSAKEVRQALRKLEDLRYAAEDLDEALRRIVEATHQLFAVDGAGLMLVDPDQLLRSIAVSDRRVHDLEGLQIHHGEGPCSTPSRTRPSLIPRTWPPRPAGPSSARPWSSGACGRCWP